MLVILKINDKPVASGNVHSNEIETTIKENKSTLVITLLSEPGGIDAIIDEVESRTHLFQIAVRMSMVFCFAIRSTDKAKVELKFQQ